MTEQPNTGSIDFTAIPTQAIGRCVQFLSQIMMGVLGQNAAILISMLSQLSASETSLMMKQTRASARDTLIGGTFQAAGQVGSGLIQTYSGVKIGAETKIQSDAKKQLDTDLASTSMSDNPEAAKTAAKMTPQEARDTYDQKIRDSKSRVKVLEKKYAGYSAMLTGVTGLAKSAMDASANLEHADQQLASQVAQHLMSVLNSTVGNVTSDFASNKPYASAVALAA